MNVKLVLSGWFLILAFAGGCDADTDADTDADPQDSESASETGDAGDSEIFDDTDTATDENADELEIVGDYVTDFGSAISVTGVEWTDEITYDGVTILSIYVISAFDNDADFLVAQNGSDNGYNPDKWSRFDWTVSKDTLYYCQSVYDAETEADATAEDDLSDPNDLDAGCCGFSWSRLVSE